MNVNLRVSRDFRERKSEKRKTEKELIAQRRSDAETGKERMIKVSNENSAPQRLCGGKSEK